MGLENKTIFVHSTWTWSLPQKCLLCQETVQSMLCQAGCACSMKVNFVPNFFWPWTKHLLANTHHGQLRVNVEKGSATSNNANNFINSVATQGSVWFYLWPSDRHSQKALDATCDPCFASSILCPPLIENNKNHSDPPKSLHKTEVSRHQRSLIWFPSGNN